MNAKQCPACGAEIVHETAIWCFDCECNFCAQTCHANYIIHKRLAGEYNDEE